MHHRHNSRPGRSRGEPVVSGTGWLRWLAVGVLMLMALILAAKGQF